MLEPPCLPSCVSVARHAPSAWVLMPPAYFSVDFFLDGHWWCEYRGRTIALARTSARHAAPMVLVDSPGGPCVAVAHLIAASGQLTSIYRMCVDCQLVSRSARLWLVNSVSWIVSDVQSNPAGSINSVWDHTIGRLHAANKFAHSPVCSGAGGSVVGSARDARRGR